MSILNDRKIKQLCQPAPFVVTRHNPAITGYNPMDFILPQVKEELSYLPEEELTNRVRDFNQSITFCANPIGISEFRKATENDLVGFKPMIFPFEDKLISHRDVPDVELGIFVGQTEKIISYGLSSFGYDVRLDNQFKIFTNINNSLIDPLNFDHKTYVDHEGEYCIIPPNSYILGLTMETFVIPKNVQVICLGKSTYARAGAIVNVTPIEAGFEGKVVIEISNSTPLPLKVYAGMGISQFIFFESNEPCQVSYADRDGKYQGQNSIVTPKG